MEGVYGGSYRSVCWYVKALCGRSQDSKKGDKSAHSPHSAHSTRSASKGVQAGRREWAQRLSRPAEKLTREEAAEVKALCEHSDIWRGIYELVQGFGQMVRERKHEGLDEQNPTLLRLTAK